MAVGVPLGLLAGYRGGFIDAVIMRPADVIMAFPAIVLVVALAGLFNQSLSLMTLAIAFVYMPIIVRVMRGAALEVQGHALYIEGARARGASHLRIMTRHVLPNAIAPVLVQASALMGVAILAESALSFIGLGVQPPTPSLGLMLSDGRSYMGDAPWLVIGPGLGIVLAVLGFNLVGDGLPQLLDPARMEAAMNMHASDAAETALAVSDLRIEFRTDGGWREAVSGVGFELARKARFLVSSAGPAAASRPSPTVSCGSCPRTPVSPPAASASAAKDLTKVPRTTACGGCAAVGSP